MTLLSRFKEMMVSRPAAGLRNAANALKQGFFRSPTTPALYNTTIDTDAARALYYNTDPTIALGGIFARPIIDTGADFIGVPHMSVQDENLDELLRTCVQKYWKDSLWEIYRNSMRDTMTWVRVRRPFPHPLVSNLDEDKVYLEIVDKDRVTAYNNPQTGYLDRVEISTMLYMEDEPYNYVNAAQGLEPSGREHEIIEIITNNLYLFYDRTDQRYLDYLEVQNDWSFIPMVPFYNDYDSALGGGSSDLENVLPFLQAFHTLLSQLSVSFGYHAAPKVKFKLNDIMTFLTNNFPESISDGKFNGRVSWQGNEIFFLESDEDVAFIEATGNNERESVTLLEFILDCICIASETPEWALVRPQTEGLPENAQTLRFEQRVWRKRNNWTNAFQMLAKMALKVYGAEPITPEISWDEISTSDIAAKANAMNSTVSSAEVASRAQVISRTTYRDLVRQYFPTMKTHDQEQAQIENELRADAKLQAELYPADATNPGRAGKNGNPDPATKKRLEMTVTPQND